MNSNYGSSNQGFPRGANVKPEAAVEDTLKSDRIQIERKTFLFSLKENPRGRFLRITEDVGGRRDTIIVPASGLPEFRKIIEEMDRTSQTNPAAAPQQP